MALQEMYDYLNAATAEYSATTLHVYPQEVLTEIGEKYQSVHEFDDGSERVISFSDTPIFNVKLRWSGGINSSDAGIIFDLYSHATKANGMARSFKWEHPNDGHTYVVRFRSSLSRDWFDPPDHGYQKVQEVTFKVLGYSTTS